MRFHKVLILVVLLMLLVTFAAGCGELAEEMNPNGPDAEEPDAGEPDAEALNAEDFNIDNLNAG